MNKILASTLASSLIELCGTIINKDGTLSWYYPENDIRLFPLVICMMLKLHRECVILIGLHQVLIQGDVDSYLYPFI